MIHSDFFISSLFYTVPPAVQALSYFFQRVCFPQKQRRSHERRCALHLTSLPVETHRGKQTFPVPHLIDVDQPSSEAGPDQGLAGPPCKAQAAAQATARLLPTLRTSSWR